MSGLGDLERLVNLTETELRRFYVGACTERFSDVRLFIRNVGVIEVDGRVFKSGVEGQADVWGYLYRKPYPMPLEIELKNVRTPERNAQKLWEAYCVANRISFLKLRAKKTETPAGVIDRWVNETATWIDTLRRLAT